MKANQLIIKPNAKRRRDGRGIAAGRGKTAGRGTKGQNARSGGKVRSGFEGGQNPLIQRIPKQRGNGAKVNKIQVIYTSQLNSLKATTIDRKSLLEAGLIKNKQHPVKLVLRGDVTNKLSVNLDRATDGAIKAVKASGGSFNNLKSLITK